MDIVVRTPHGDADVSIASHAATTTLGEIVAAVTGQAVPRLVLVDGRTVDADALLDAVDLLVGSVVTSAAPTPPDISDADVELVQISGHGAGRITRLGPGRYRIGPGRRSNAHELDVAPVDHSVFELVVEPTAATVHVSRSSETSSATDVSHASVVPAAAGVAIDGKQLEEVTPWHEGTLTVGSRAFQLDVPAHPDETPTHRRSEPDGTLLFSRPPRRMPGPERRPVVDAVRAATHHSPTLWERRPAHPDAFQLPIGVGPDGVGTIDLDLASQRALAIVGAERFRDALTRSLVIEAATLHGPADLGLVVLTHPDRLAHWDWAKWLTHLRVDDRPAIWSSRHDVTRWAQGLDTAGVSGTTPQRSSALTVVIIDDPDLWSRPDSPVRSIVSDPPEDLRLIALCDPETRAPAVCTTVISEGHDEFAHVRSFARAGDDQLVRPALTEDDVAVRVARALAPLADVDRPKLSAPPAPDSDRIALSELVGVAATGDILERWADGSAGSTAAVGRSGDRLVEVPTTDDVTVVVGPSMGDAFDVAATSLLAQCVDRSPDAMWIAPIVLEPGPRADLLWQLPHATDRHDVDAAIDTHRLLARLRAVLADERGPANVVLVVEAASASSTSPDPDWLVALADGVRTIAGLSMVVVTDRPDVANLVGDTVVRVERRYDVPGAARRVALLTTPGGLVGETFTPVQPTAPGVAGLELRPFVVGRALTPLERRIEQQHAHAANAADPALDNVVAMLREAASRERSDAPPSAASGRTVVPPPIPTRVALDELFDASPGDGVPLGLVDDPNSAGLRVRWWQPGSGSMLVFGSRRSGMEQVLSTILLGIIDRFSALDVDLLVVEPSAARRRALADLGRAIRIVAPDQRAEVTAALDDIDEELKREAATSTAAAPGSGPRTVVLIGDLVDLRRRYANQSVAPRIDDVVTRAAAAGSGIDVVAAAAELDGAGPFAHEASSCLVGASSDHAELASLGVDRPGDLDGIVGRCRAFPGGDLAQMATTDATIEALLARRSTRGAP